MNELLQQIAETLKLGTDGVQTLIEQYPQLRQEYIYFQMAEKGKNVVYLIGFIIAFILFWAVLGYIFNNVGDKTSSEYDNKKDKLGRRKIKVLSGFLLFLVIIHTALDFTQIALSPEIHMIRNIISINRTNEQLKQ